MTHGKICDFSFYVRAFDTKSRYADYRPPADELSLKQAQQEFERQCGLNPRHVYTVLGLDFRLTAPEYANLRPRDRQGAVDLLRCSDGKLSLIEDYKTIDALLKESLIAVNTVQILQNERDRLQRLSDEATANCAKDMRLFLDRAHSPSEVQAFASELIDRYGIERCKCVLGSEINNMLANGEEVDNDLAVWFAEQNDSEYRDVILSGTDAEYLKLLGCAVWEHEIKHIFSETAAKLINSGLINSEAEDISERTNAIAAEIRRHNELEDSGQAADDQLDL